MPPAPQAENAPLQRALADLRSLAHTERGVIETTACGPEAVPALRDILFAREPSGLAAPRCAAVEALAALHAETVLIDFLAAPHLIADPVERVGTETVMDCAVRALLRCDDPRLPTLLLHLAETRLLPGAIGWLGTRRRIEALDCLLAALGDDVARPAAMAALCALGAAAIPALWRTVAIPRPDRDEETGTSRRRRRAAAAVLRDLRDDFPPPAPAELERLAGDADPAIAAFARCRQLDTGPAADRHAAACHLLAMRDWADYSLRSDIEDCLAAHPDLTRAALAEGGWRDADVLHRVPPHVAAQRDGVLPDAANSAESR